MIITPKNWQSFQHYKERAPSWIKLHKGLLSDFEYIHLPLASRALAPLLWLLASEYKDGQIDASMEKIAFRVHTSVDELREALKPLIDSGFFEASEVLAEPERDAISRREEKRTRIEEKNIVAKAPMGNVEFENLKKVYPRRNGNYGWKAAEKKFLALTKTGVDPKHIIAAAIRLGETLRSRVGTEFIPMPATWLNSEDFTDIAAASFVEEAPEVDWDAQLDRYHKGFQWNVKWYGGEPGTANCRVPADVLAKHGYVPGDTPPISEHISNGFSPSTQ